MLFNKKQGNGGQQQQDAYPYPAYGYEAGYDGSYDYRAYHPFAMQGQQGQGQMQQGQGQPGMGGMQGQGQPGMGQPGMGGMQGQQQGQGGMGACRASKDRDFRFRLCSPSLPPLKAYPACFRLKNPISKTSCG
nr:hypothetical protein [Metabacillus flavus]